MSRSKLEWALWWAERGVKVFPCAPDAKRPLTRHGCKDASSDEMQIRHWWSEHPNANIGGAPDSIDCWVLDVDDRDSLTDLEIQNEALPRTLTVETPSQGRHYWFEGECRNSASRIAKGLDVRGRGGYVLLPGSEIQGRTYTLVRDEVPARAPEWLAGLAAPQMQTEPKAAVTDTEDLDINVARAEEFLARAKVAVEGDGGDALTYETACWVRDMGISEAKCAELMEAWNDRCEPPWEPGELARKIHNAYHYGENDPGARAIEPASEAFKTLEGDQSHELDNRQTRNQRTKRARFRLRGEAEQDARKDPNWIIPGWLPENSLTMLYGPSGSFKSFIALEFALALASGFGSVLGGKEDQRCPTIYLAGEGLVGIEKSRRPAWKYARGVLPEDILPFYTSSDFPMLKRSGKELPELIESIQAQGVSPRLIVLDTLAALMAGMNESAAEDATMAMWQLQQLVNAFPGCCVLFVHHSGKDRGQGARGSSAIPAALDVAIECQADPDTLTVCLRAGPQPHGKMKDAESPHPVYLKGHRSLQSLVFDPISSLEFHTLRAKARELPPEKVEAALREIGEETSTHVLAVHLLGDRDYDEDAVKAMQKKLTELGKDELSTFYRNGKWKI